MNASASAHPASHPANSAPATPIVSGDDRALNALLNRIVDEPEIHARWLNTLAFLEFMGTRKIARSLNGRRADRIALQHLAEEARHAYFFKRSIERVAPDADPGFALSELLAGFSAARYFHGLDALVHRDLADADPTVGPELCYLYVTTLIEERAGWLYPAYDAVLEARNLPLRLTGVILEEEQHLADMYSAARRLDPQCEERLQGYRVQEAQGFAGFFTRLQAAV
ncbi:MAG: hypothetical protein NXI24_07860 [bacterium]|nr:hypothetical protein [bacterium]